MGILPETSYAETEFTLAPGDDLALYTDGLLEARSAGGEIYGFERLGSLFMRRPGAAEAAETAVRFGQEDDITVLRLPVRSHRGPLSVGQSFSYRILVCSAETGVKKQGSGVRGQR